MGARDATMADTLPESPEPKKGDSDPTAGTASRARQRPGSAQRTCDATNGGFTTSTACGRPRTSTATSSPSATPAAVSSSASAMPVRRRRRERAAGDLADRGAVGAEHRHARARDAPARRRAGPTAAAPGRPPSRRAAPRGPRTPASSSPPPSPARAWTGRDLRRQLVAVQRVAHLGAQRVARAEAARPDAEVLPGLEDGVPQLAGAVGVDQQLVAVLAGVAGPADGHLGGAVRAGAGHERHVGSSPGRPSSSSTCSERGPCTARTATSACRSVTVTPAGAASASRAQHLGGVGGVRHQQHVVRTVQVDDQVVDDAAAPSVAAQRVLRLARADARQVVGQARVDERRGARVRAPSPCPGARRRRGPPPRGRRCARRALRRPRTRSASTSR